jgi:chromosome partitioning protein
MISVGLFHLKGGVGKSALTVFLADFLSSLHEQRVLVVDLDPQGSASKVLLAEATITQGFAAKKSLTGLLRTAKKGGVPKKAVEACLFQRAAGGKPRRGSYPIGSLSILATDRDDWRKLNDEIFSIPEENRSQYLDLLKDVLREVEDDYDIALIDFPGSEIPFWTLMGLRATDRWLLPVIPDNFSLADIQAVSDTVQRAMKNSKHVIYPLGTLLTICPKRGSTVYKKTKNALSHLEKNNFIPPLFSKDAEVLHRPDAQKATDWKSEESKTLVQRYGPSTGPFHFGLRKLANEVMQRLGKADSRDKLSFGAGLRRMLTDYWRG